MELACPLQGQRPGGTPCRDTEDVSSELRARSQDKQKRPAFPRAFSTTSVKPWPHYRKETI